MYLISCTLHILSCNYFIYNSLSSSTDGSDYNEPVVTTVTFGSGVTRASYPVPIVDDSNIEDTESFAAVLTTTESNVNIGDSTAFVTILDDDCKLFLQHIHNNIR